MGSDLNSSVGSLTSYGTSGLAELVPNHMLPYEIHSIWPNGIALWFNQRVYYREWQSYRLQSQTPKFTFDRLLTGYTSLGALWSKIIKNFKTTEP